MNESTLLKTEFPANYHKKCESWSPAEEVASCLVELRVLLERSFPEVTYEIVIEFILAHGRLVKTRRTFALSHLGSSWAAGLDLAQLSLPLFSFSFLRFECCSFPFSLIVIIFSFVSLLLPVYSYSNPPPPPTFLSPQAVCDAVRRKLHRLASRFWTTDFNFRCLQ